MKAEGANYIHRPWMSSLHSTCRSHWYPYSGALGASFQFMISHRVLQAQVVHDLPIFGQNPLSNSQQFAEAVMRQIMTWIAPWLHLLICWPTDCSMMHQNLNCWLCHLASARSVVLPGAIWLLWYQQPNCTAVQWKTKPLSSSSNAPKFSPNSLDKKLYDTSCLKATGKNESRR